MGGLRMGTGSGRVRKKNGGVDDGGAAVVDDDGVPVVGGDDIPMAVRGYERWPVADSWKSRRYRSHPEPKGEPAAT